MANLSANVKGKLSAFTHVSFTITVSDSMEGKTLLARLGDEILNPLVLGDDRFIILEKGTHTYTYAIKDGASWMLDTLNEVKLIAEPGQKGASNSGNFVIERSWFSKEIPKDGTIVAGSSWVNLGGNHKIQQFKGVTTVKYTGMTPNSWTCITTPVEHDFPEYTAFSITLKNTGDKTTYVRINPAYPENGKNVNVFDRPSEILLPGEEATFTVSGLPRQISRITLFICSSWDVPAGTYSGSIEISGLKFLKLDNPEWKGDGVYQVIQRGNVADLTYRHVKPGTWKNIKTENFKHDFPSQNVMTVKVKNTGNSTAYVRVVPMSNGKNLMEPRSTILAAGETQNITLGPLSAKVDKVVIYICSASDVPDGDYSGTLEITKPVFGYQNVEEIDGQKWFGSKGYTLKESSGKVSVSYKDIEPETTWDNVYTDAFTHDFTKYNTVSVTIKNTGSQISYVRMNPTDSSKKDMNLRAVAIAPGETKTISAALDKKISRVILFVCSSWSTPKGKYSGSVEITNPIFSFTDPGKGPGNKSWFGSPNYSLDETDGVVKVTYKDIVPETKWDNLYTEDFKHDLTKHNTVSVMVTNNGAQTAYIRMRPTDSTNYDMNLSAVAIAAGETKAVTATLDKKITKVVLFVCSSWGTPAGSYSGTVTVSMPVFSFENRPEPTPTKWNGSKGYTLDEKDDVVKVTYKDIVPETKWDYISTEAFSHDFSKDNTVSVKVTNNGTQTAYVRMRPTDSTNADMNLSPVAIAAGETRVVTATLDKKITKVVLFVCSSWGTPAGSYSGTVTVELPTFSYIKPKAWFGHQRYTINEDDEKVSFNYDKIKAESWLSVYTESFVHNYPADSLLKLTLKNPGTQDSYIRINPTDSTNVDMNLSPIHLMAGETKEISILVEKKITKLTVFICSSWGTPKDVEFTGSLELSKLRFEPAILNPAAESATSAKLKVFKKGAQIFSDRNISDPNYSSYKFGYYPSSLENLTFVQGSIEGGSASVTRDGWVYALTPPPGDGNSASTALLDLGFTRVNKPSWAMLGGASGQVVIYEKEVTAGETITWGKFAVLVTSETQLSFDDNGNLVKPDNQLGSIKSLNNHPSKKVARGEVGWIDRPNFTMQNIPWFMAGKSFIATKIDAGSYSVEVTKAGYIYFLTSTAADADQTNSLVNQGFTLVSSNVFTSDIYLCGNALANGMKLLEKEVAVGDIITYGRWAMPFYSGELPEDTVESKPFASGEKIFKEESNTRVFAKYQPPAFFEKSFLLGSLENGGIYTTKSEGFIYAITPKTGDNSAAEALVNHGFVALDVPAWSIWTGALKEVTGGFSVYEKQVKTGEVISWSKYAILVESLGKIDFGTNGGGIRSDIELAVIESVNAVHSTKTIAYGTQLWSDRAQFPLQEIPWFLAGKKFLSTQMDSNKPTQTFKATKAGYVYVLTKTSGDGDYSGSLITQGFTKVSDEVFSQSDHLCGYAHAVALSNMKLYEKYVEVGDTVSYNRWVLPFFSGKP